jgi:hypothetical protein
VMTILFPSFVIAGFCTHSHSNVTFVTVRLIACIYVRTDSAA